jgi:spore germination protein KB
MPTAILFVPGHTVDDAHQSAWLTPFIAMSVGFAVLWIAYKMGKRFPRHTLIQYVTIIFGKTFGKILGGGYIIFFLVFNLLIIREITDFLKIALLPNTPIWFLSLIFILVGSYGAISGVEVLARSAQFVFPIFVGGSFILLIPALQEMSLKELLPVLEDGLIPVIKASITPAAWFGEIIILAFLFPFINKPNEVLRKGSFTILAMAAILSIDIILALTILGSDLPGRLAVPTWKVIRYLELGRTFLRVETLLIFLWIPSAVIKFALIYFLGCLTSAQVFGVKAQFKVFIPMGLILWGAASFLFSNTIQLNEFLNKIWPPFAFCFEIILPSAFLIVSILRKKQSR